VEFQINHVKIESILATQFLGKVLYLQTKEALLINLLNNNTTIMNAIKSELPFEFNEKEIFIVGKEDGDTDYKLIHLD
jgi:hypothetical protein